MHHLDLKQCNEPDEYEKSEVWISTASPDGRYFAGNMQRCGVTAPGYPGRATYRPVSNTFKVDEIYVYDGGYFWNSREWHRFVREHRRSPAAIPNYHACIKRA
jgi:hypothetical protein